MKQKPFSIRLTDAAREELERLAEAEKRSLSNMIETCIFAYKKTPKE